MRCVSRHYYSQLNVTANRKVSRFLDPIAGCDTLCRFFLERPMIPAKVVSFIVHVDHRSIAYEICSFRDPPRKYDRTNCWQISSNFSRRNTSSISVFGVSIHSSRGICRNDAYVARITNLHEEESIYVSRFPSLCVQSNFKSVVRKDNAWPNVRRDNKFQKFW